MHNSPADIKSEDDVLKSKDKMSSDKRILYLDIARTIAIILVVLCHATETIYRIDTSDWTMLSIQSRIIRTVYFTLGRLGVPLFLFISGRLLLSKKIESSSDCFKFYKKNLLPLVIAVEIWTILYYVFSMLFYNNAFDFGELLKDMLFLKKSDMPNMWYMPMIIGIYLAVPFLAIIVKKIDFKVLLIPIIISIISFILVPNINEISKTFFNEQYSSVLDLSFLGGIYGLYFVLGYYIGNDKFKKLNTLVLITICIIVFALTCYYQFWRYNIGKSYKVWYDFIGLFIVSNCLFELLSRIKIDLNNNVNRFILFISKSSTAIFFIHIVVQKILREKLIPFDSIFRNSVAVPVLTFLVLIISIIIIVLLSKIKIIKNKVLLIKE